MPLETREFEKLLLASQPVLFEYCRKLCRHREKAEDLQQDVNMRAWTKRELYVEGNFNAWLKTVARNLHINNAKKEALLPIKSMVDFGEYEREDQDGIVGSMTKGGLRYMTTLPNQEDFWLENRIMEAIATLPPHQALLVNKKLEGLTYSQIATPLGIKPNNAKQRYFNVVKELRELLLSQGLLDD